MRRETGGFSPHSSLLTPHFLASRSSAQTQPRDWQSDPTHPKINLLPQYQCQGREPMLLRVRKYRPVLERTIMLSEASSSGAAPRVEEGGRACCSSMTMPMWPTPSPAFSARNITSRGRGRRRRGLGRRARAHLRCGVDRAGSGRDGRLSLLAEIRRSAGDVLASC